MIGHNTKCYEMFKATGSTPLPMCLGMHEL